MNFKWRQLAGLLVSILICAAIAGSATPAMGQQGATNLLVNGDFEAWDWSNAGFPFQDGIPEVQVAEGWRAFYVDRAPAGVPMPDNWKRPEFRDVKALEYPNRVHSGALAQKYFTFGGQHMAGIYQQVGNITPGTRLRFSIYMQTWSCVPAAEQWNLCPTGHLSNSPSRMHTRVGIDPFGGVDPWSPNVVWSPEREAHDQWTQFQVEAVAGASTVTVFTYSNPNWSDHVFRVHNDVYIDDGSLIALNQVAVTPTPSQPEEPPESEPTGTPDPSLPTPTPAPTGTPAPTATPAATPTPRPDGATVHVVKDGDSLLAIALQYDVTLDRLQELNELSNLDFISIGQELVIDTTGEAGAAQPPAPVAEEEPEEEAEPADSEAPPAAIAAAPDDTEAPSEPWAVPLPLPTATAQPVTAAEMERTGDTGRSGRGWVLALVALAGALALGAVGFVVVRRVR